LPYLLILCVLMDCCVLHVCQSADAVTLGKRARGCLEEVKPVPSPQHQSLARQLQEWVAVARAGASDPRNGELSLHAAFLLGWGDRNMATTAVSSAVASVKFNVAVDRCNVYTHLQRGWTGSRLNCRSKVDSQSTLRSTT